MGKNLFERFDIAKNIFNKSEEILDFNIKEICFNTNQNLINKTKYTQPAIFIYSIIVNNILT